MSPSSLVNRTRTATDALMDAFEQCEAVLAQYTALGGGEAAIGAHFLDSEGQPREDLDYTYADIMGAVVTLDAIRTLLAAGHRTNLEKARP